jgi:hypothetical protein
MAAFQIGSVDVDVEAVEAAGRPLAELAREFGAELDPLTSASAPRDGWRVLAGSGTENVLLGARAEDGLLWHLAAIHRGATQGPTTVYIHPGTERLRRGRVERARGLELRWPGSMPLGDGSEVYAIDVVNTGDTRWLPDGDSFQVVGTFVGVGVTEHSFGWAHVHQDTAVPLDPGEYARVRVGIDSNPWNRLEPGEYDLHAHLVDLNLASPMLRVTLAAETIERRRAPVHHRELTPEQRRRHLERDIERMHVQLAAGESLPALAEALSGVDSRGDAMATIAAALGTDPSMSEIVLMSSLREMLPATAEQTRMQLRDAERRLAEFEADSGDGVPDSGNSQ